MRARHILALGAALVSAVACQKTDYLPELGPISPDFDFRLEPVPGTAGIGAPIDLQAPPGDPRLFIAELTGTIRIVQNGTPLATPFLNISSRVFTEGEGGLLSFAFHPQFESGEPFVFVHFIERVPGNNGNIVVERYRLSATDPNLLDAASATPVISIPHIDFSNHYGGRVAFGPDGMLYLSTGDGGGGGDQLMNGQNAATRLGKLLRLDVSSLPYVIPPDNPSWPTIGQNENWAIGLRNPFRYAFDFPTGRLYIADVGQGQREEVDVVSAADAGLNYGWNIMEGAQCFFGPCPTPGLTPPVYDYNHAQGCAIIGGYVYRGMAIPELQGTYLFSDLCGGFLRGLTLDANGAATVVQAPTADTGIPLSFGQDGFGEVYVLNGSTQPGNNPVLKVVKP